MQNMKWILTLFVACVLCSGFVLAADPVTPAGGGAGKEEQAGHAGHPGHASHSGHAMHDMSDCKEMDDKKCMEMEGKQCDHHKDKKILHKSHDACDTKKGAAKSGGKTPAEKKLEGKDVTVKPAAKAVEPVLSEMEGRALAQKSNCFGCHSIDKKVVGPAWKDVAAKYRGDADAENKLIAKVSKGSSGTWGSVPMPANSPVVKDTDIKALVKFVLSLK